MRIELCCCTATLLREISDKNFSQKSIVLTYAMAINSSEPKDWESVNDAIIKRWSRSGLEYIKRMAWKQIEAQQCEREKNCGCEGNWWWNHEECRAWRGKDGRS